MTLLHWDLTLRVIKRYEKNPWGVGTVTEYRRTLEQCHREEALSQVKCDRICFNPLEAGFCP